MKNLIFIYLAFFTIVATGQTNTFPNSGNVGIGTLTPTRKLHVVGTGLFTTQTTGSNLPGIFIKPDEGSLELASAINNVTYIDFKGFNSLSSDYIGRLRYMFGEGFNFYVSSLSIPSFTIRENGNVGINIASPTEKFQIGKTFVFHDGGHDVIFFSADSNGDLDATKYAAEIRFNPVNGKLSLGTSELITSIPVTALTIDRLGRIGIGTSNPDEKLTIKGKIHAEEVKVDLFVPPSDYVFQKYFTGVSNLKPDYEMLSLSQVESFIKENYHLPEIPSAKDIQDNGIELGEMSNLLLQKIEELTLYIIEQNKRIEALESQINEIK